MQRRLALYRNLVSLIKAPRSEEELIHFVIDTIHQQFPDYRVTYARLEGEMGVLVYSRQPEGMPSLTGKRFPLSSLGNLASMLFSGKPLVIRDVREEPHMEGFAKELAAMSGNISRIDVPFSDGEGHLSAISLTSSVPVEWDESTVGVLVEISELVGLMIREARAREQIRRNEELFRQFTHSVGVVMWISDIAKNEIVYVNSAYEKIWGRSIEGLYREPRSFLDAIHPDDRPRVLAALPRQQEGTYEERYRVVRPDGQIRWVKDRAFPVRDEHGQVYRIVGISEDITDLRLAQERLEATQAQVVSNAKFAALGEMASGIAHEINNPLAVIHGLTVQLQELFRKGSASTPMVLDSLGSMEKMANRIAAIVKGLRTFSRQTEGDPLLPADLAAIVQETMALCEAKLKAADIVLTVKLPPSKTMVRCRSSELSQVLLNLVSNAYDAVLPVKERAITIEIERKAGRVRLSVADSGPGIEPSVRDRIFQPFYTTKEVGRGTGLGLSISKGIVEAHGGSLFLDTSSRNTRFVVELPSETT